jgi:NADPH:quinone reductase-like Zn-dependent oxidoreductase
MDSACPGRIVSLGAIAVLVWFEQVTMYLKGLTPLGCTAWDEEVFPNLVSYIEAGEIRPLLTESFPLKQIAAAQERFLEKTHVGKFVLVPPAIRDQA